ncbi:3-dehydroquinate synthase [Enterococcus moraviensis ATCC BAA-383]|uniref:3-dehydroquinate synthase n=1 Tax=Enterococcus moraviensis ATCC BAA-383 TaxID=1158609 RepID=R2TK80_9ENTE|nr:3-dehydroquinate synthase [Enterococcus moraviensis]EOI00482.1 3-dehydroquinate synthase [Enterococcus moraviensis ATCC BAA-383]EOT73289.1 3-dehydroquinate synthase [Enterococcus moraviensis ATCC BAA-383]OJG68845.1 3-dehydroquinate synthase [Enterococcus moraviensis]
MKLTVNLPNHSYDLSIENGLLKKIGSWAKELWSSQKIVIITDTNVQPLYGDLVYNSLKEAGFDPSTFVIEAGEQSKRLNVAAEIYDFLAEEGMTRSDGIIALGGGVVGDLAGFVASTYMRGLHFLQVPTTLLAQVDSSIGGKTAVNTTKAKNLVGTFAQPDGVLIDPDTLNTLEVRRIREGIAEIIKSAAIADEKLWQKLDELTDEHDLIAHATEIIAACCKIKRNVVEKDELDNGIRLLLNFGHTIGHALENTAGYGNLTHGEGVAIGMSQITRVAESNGLTPVGTTDQLNKMIQKFHLPITSKYWDQEQLYTALTHDKKARGGKINIILLASIGEAKIVRIPIEEMKSYLN